MVASDVDGRVAAALEGSPAVLVDRGGDDDASAWWAGAVAALGAVAETSALLLWPGRMTWVDPETVTSLIEAHGRDGDAAIRPRRAGTVGWPLLVPASLVATPPGTGGAAQVDRAPALDDVLVGGATVALELGDPGTVLGNEVRLEDLPAYMGPPEPVGGPPPEWGAAAAETADPEIPPPI